MSKKNKPDPADVPVVREFLTLLSALNGAARMFLNESIMAADMQVPEPEHYMARCSTLFISQYGEYAKKIGLKVNDSTFRSLMRLEADYPEMLKEMGSTAVDDLPEIYVFNPFMDQGKGGLRVMKSGINPGITFPIAVDQPVEISANDNDNSSEDHPGEDPYLKGIMERTSRY